MFVRYQDELWRFMYESGRLSNDSVEIFLRASQMDDDFIQNWYSFFSRFVSFYEDIIGLLIGKIIIKQINVCVFT